MATRRTLFIHATLALLLHAASSVAWADGPERLAPEEWCADVRHLVDEVLRRHPNPAHYGPDEATFRRAGEELCAKLPGLSDRRIVLELFRLQAMLQDAHSVAVWESARHLVRWRRLPVHFYPGRDGWFVMSAESELQSILGAQVTHIGGRPVEDVAAAIAPYVSADNAMNRLDIVADVATMPVVLLELGIIDDIDRVRLDLVANGRTTTVWLSPMRSRRVRWIRARDGAPAPLWLKRQNEPYWYEYLADDETVYMQLNAIRNRPSPGESFAAFCGRMFAFIEANPVRRLVIDLRHNAGGDNAISWPLVHGILRCSKLERHGRVFAIIGRGSQSAAPTLCRRLETHTGCIFVGEPTGGRPNGHGNASTIRLPNSGIDFLCSSVFVRETIVPDRRPWIAPDVTAMLTPEDYAAGRDPALEAIHRYRPPRAFRDVIGDVLALADGDAFVRRYEAYRSIPENRFTDLENDVNECGDDLLRAGRVADAITVFELNASEHPWAWNAYDSLAEAYLAAGRRDEAIEMYERSFALNRSNFAALRALDGLKK